MKVKIGEREIELHYSFRMYILFENRLGESVDFTKLNNYTYALNLFYCALLSSMQYHKMELDLEFDEFMDWSDTKEGMSTIPEFLAWYFTNYKVQEEIFGKAEEKLIAEITEKNNKKSDKKSDKKGKTSKNV